jgi:hypothetical protein
MRTLTSYTHNISCGIPDEFYSNALLFTNLRYIFLKYVEILIKAFFRKLKIDVDTENCEQQLMLLRNTLYSLAKNNCKTLHKLSIYSMFNLLKYDTRKLKEDGLLFLFRSWKCARS